MNNTPTPRTDEIPWIPNPIFYNSDLDLVRYVRIKEVRQLERELAAVTEQRDRLIEALERIADYQGRFAEEDPESIAAEALQSLTQNKP